MNVLFVTCGMPSDRRNGLTLRVHQLAAHLDRQRAAPFLLSVNPVGSIAPSDARHYVEYAEIDVAPRTLGAIHSAWASATLSRWSVSLRYPDVRESILEHARRWSIDAVVEFAGLVLPSFDAPLGGFPLLCDLIDAPTVATARVVSQQRPMSRTWWRARYDLARFRAYQRRDLRFADAISVVSELDAIEQRRSLASVPVCVVPNGVDTRYFDFRPDEPKRFDLVFEGNMSFVPNVDAARYLAEVIFPIVRRERPSATLALVGKDPAPEVSKLASSAITVTGTVTDVRPYLSSARVFSCAMRLGAGIKNKILQAWSIGVPVVCTPESTPGLDGVDGTHFLVRDDPADFAHAIVELIDDPERSHHVATKAREHVQQAFSWEIQSERVLDILEALHGSRKCERTVAA